MSWYKTSQVPQIQVPQAQGSPDVMVGQIFKDLDEPIRHLGDVIAADPLLTKSHSDVYKYADEIKELAQSLRDEQSKIIPDIATQ